MSTKISQLTSATDVTANDLIQIVDVEDGVMAPSGTNKKVTASLLAKELAKQPLEPGIVISGSSSADAVRITQTGSGNALVIEDSASPDSTPLVINSNGQILIGKISSDSSLRTIDIVAIGDIDGINNGNIRSVRSGNNGDGVTFHQGKTRGTPEALVIVQNNDNLGNFLWTGYDGVIQQGSASISCFVDGTPSESNLPSRLVFNTTASDSGTAGNRMVITNSGNVGIATSTPSSKLHVAGDITVSSATVATSATAGANGDVPAQVAGYLAVNINGTARKIPYYA
jgi:hypothetical protein